MYPSSFENMFAADETMLDLSRYKEMRTEKEPNTINDESEQTGEGLRSSEDVNLGSYWELFSMIENNNWPGVERFVRNHPEALTAKIDTKETLLELITRFGDYKATRLIDMLAQQNWLIDRLAQQNVEGGTIYTFCAARGNLGVLKALVRQNRDLLNRKCNRGFLPVHYAALYGEKDTLRYLLKETTAEIHSGKDGTLLLEHLICTNLYDIALDLLKNYPAIGRDHIKYRNDVLRAMAEKPLAFANGKGSRRGLLQRLIYDCWYPDQLLYIYSFMLCTVGLKKKKKPSKFIFAGIPVEKEHVASIQTDDNRTEDDEDIETLIAGSNSHSRKSPTFGPIRQITATFGAMCHKLHMMLWNGLMHLAPDIKVIHEEKVRHMQAVEIVRIICKGVIWDDPQNHQLLKKTFFNAATLGNSKFVQEIIAACKGSVYWEDENKHTIFHVAVCHRSAEVFNLIYSSTFKLNRLAMDYNGNNILHFVGKLVSSSEVAGAALQMQRELEWFKAVENLVHPFLREAANIKGQTPREVFTEEHKELVKEGQKWMKETATACSVVAALIITVMFAAAFTVPGGNDSRGIANFLHESSFIIFAVSDALSLFSSIISVLMFLGILTSRYSEEDFLLSLPRKLIIGLIAMFFSIASMMVSFGATIYLVLFSTWKWVFIPIALVGCVPVTLFALLQFPLLVDMYSSTYGRGIFGRK